MQNLLKYTMGQSSHAVVVLADEGGSILFRNDALVQWKDQEPVLVLEIKRRQRGYSKETGSTWETGRQQAAGGGFTPCNLFSWYGWANMPPPIRYRISRGKTNASIVSSMRPAPIL